MAENPPAGSPRIVARLAYNDVASALEFLENAYGFAEREGTRIEMADGSVVLVEINVVDSYVMIGSAGAHDIDAPGNVGGITQALIVYVDDIDRLYEKAKNAGAEIVCSVNRKCETEVPQATPTNTMKRTHLPIIFLAYARKPPATGTESYAKY